ncbi:N-acetylglucosamine kinase [Rhodobacteraceae bacterium]|nr:N-acetylglucosamine kinase [Paracoccaceae bacterium]
MTNTTIKYIIGIDGGGSGCRVAITDRDGTLLSESEAGPANATSDLDGTIANIKAALTDAVDEAGLPDPELAHARGHAGIAGVLDLEDAQTIADAMPMPTTVTEDTVTSLQGALGDREGILLSIGTGTVVGVSRDGIQSFIGGWGLTLSDQASGAWLGRELLREVLLCHDGLAPPSDLTRRALEHFDDSPNQIAAYAAKATPAEFAILAPEVVLAAENGDPLGLNLMQAGAIYLTNAIDVLGLGRSETLCLTGGLGPSYKQWLTPNHRSCIAAPEGTALDGALWLAEAAAGENND